MSDPKKKQKTPPGSVAKRDAALRCSSPRARRPSVVGFEDEKT